MHKRDKNAERETMFLSVGKKYIPFSESGAPGYLRLSYLTQHDNNKLHEIPRYNLPVAG